MQWSGMFNKYFMVEWVNIAWNFKTFFHKNTQNAFTGETIYNHKIIYDLYDSWIVY